MRLGDVADISALPPRLKERASEVVVASLRDEQQTLSSRDLAARARAALPGLTDWLPSSPDHAVQVTWTRAQAATASPVAAVARPPEEPAVRAGDALTIRIRVGAVTVEREVRALQAGWPGRRLFVRTPEGAALAVRLEPAS